MPKRSSRNESAETKAGSSGTQEDARTAKSKAVLSQERAPSLSEIAEQEFRNEQALDEAAGVSRRSSLAPPPPAAPAPKPFHPNSREKLLYKIACSGSPLGDDFFDQFTDIQEILTLALNISVRLLVVAICNSELVPTQRIASMRLVAALNGKQTPATEEEQSVRPTPLQIPAIGDNAEARAAIEKIRELSKTA